MDWMAAVAVVVRHGTQMVWAAMAPKAAMAVKALTNLLATLLLAVEAQAATVHPLVVLADSTTSAATVAPAKHGLTASHTVAAAVVTPTEQPLKYLAQGLAMADQAEAATVARQEQGPAAQTVMAAAEAVAEKITLLTAR
jgi:hypothetical protein